MGSIGNRNKENKNLLTEEKIQKIVSYNHSNIKWDLYNLFVFGWESDALILTKSGYFYEYEIKISRSDFKNDFKHKENKHNILIDPNNNIKPNYFSYVVPENLISVDEVPEYAGLFYVMNNSGRLQLKKSPPKLHKEKIDVNSLNLLDKFYYNFKNSLNKYNDIKSKEKELEVIKETNYNIGYNKGINNSILAYITSCQHRYFDENSYRYRCKLEKKEYCGTTFFCDLCEKFIDEMRNINIKNK